MKTKRATSTLDRERPGIGCTASQTTNAVTPAIEPQGAASDWQTAHESESCAGTDSFGRSLSEASFDAVSQ
ncbi:hypothetical protein [Stieleria neptunia]|uniref:hypothetical protein n=1 Tax=Stieleria neptunia TaxID=2527979 RepID=UPI0011A2D000|nr:hypothetical protein [Stieleria neptunia]